MAVVGPVNEATYGSGEKDDPIPITVTIPSTADRVTYVWIAMRQGATIVSVIWDVAGVNESLTEVSDVVGGDGPRVACYRGIGLTAKTATMTIDKSGNQNAGVSVETWTNVDQTTPNGTPQTDTGTGEAASVSVSSATGEKVSGVVGGRTNFDSKVLGADQTQQAQFLGGTGGTSGKVEFWKSWEPGAGSVTHSYAWTNTKGFAEIAIGINEVAAAAADPYFLFHPRRRVRDVFLER